MRKTIALFIAILASRIVMLGAGETEFRWHCVGLPVSGSVAVNRIAIGYSGLPSHPLITNISSGTILPSGPVWTTNTWGSWWTEQPVYTSVRRVSDNVVLGSSSVMPGGAVTTDFDCLAAGCWWVSVSITNMSLYSRSFFIAPRDSWGEWVSETFGWALVGGGGSSWIYFETSDTNGLDLAVWSGDNLSDPRDPTAFEGRTIIGPPPAHDIMSRVLKGLDLTWKPCETNVPLQSLTWWGSYGELTNRLSSNSLPSNAFNGWTNTGPMDNETYRQGVGLLLAQMQEDGNRMNQGLQQLQWQNTNSLMQLERIRTNLEWMVDHWQTNSTNPINITVTNFNTNGINVVVTNVDNSTGALAFVTNWMSRTNGSNVMDWASMSNGWAGAVNAAFENYQGFGYSEPSVPNHEFQMVVSIGGVEVDLNPMNHEVVSVAMSFCWGLLWCLVTYLYMSWQIKEFQAFFDHMYVINGGAGTAQMILGENLSLLERAARWLILVGLFMLPFVLLGFFLQQNTTLLAEWADGMGFGSVLGSQSGSIGNGLSLANHIAPLGVMVGYAAGALTWQCSRIWASNLLYGLIKAAHI